MGHPAYYFAVRNAITPVLLSAAVMAAVAAPQHSHSELQTVQISRPHIIIRGAYLSRVEIWAIPTGTGITPEEFVLLGNAHRANQAGNHEIWIFPTPSCDTDRFLLATEVFAKGFSDNGDVIGTKSLPYRGATEVHEALCGRQ